MQRLGLTSSEIEKLQHELAKITADPLKACKHLPLADIPVFDKLAPYWKEWHAHPGYDDYWRKSDVTSIPGRINVPVLNVAGWYDIFLLGALQLQRLLQERSDERVRKEHRLLVGPWEHVSHLNLMPSSAGQWEFGPAALSGPRSWTDLTLNFFDKWVKGDTRPDVIERQASVQYFMMGENRWCGSDTWPPKHVATDFYLRSAGAANTRFGNGTLTSDAPANDPPDSFLYDPAAPVPTVGGRTLFYHPRLGPPGVFDQAKVEERNDVLVYTSALLSEPLRIAGPVSVKLFAASSCVDTDFTAKLVDVDPSGYCANLAEGIVRARYREGAEKEVMLSPGKTTEFAIDLWSVAHQFGVGHAIRLEISSSNFPRYSRNLNSRVNPAVGTEDVIEVATQQVFHDVRHPSRLSLPVLESEVTR
jgi:putative CocE/NonD family hydrolase